MMSLCYARTSEATLVLSSGLCWQRLAPQLVRQKELKEQDMLAAPGTCYASGPIELRLFSQRASIRIYRPTLVGYGLDFPWDHQRHYPMGPPKQMSKYIFA